MSVHARRIGIDAYIKGMQQADGPEAEEPSPRDSNANKQHELRAPQQGSNLTRMRVLPLTALLEYGAIPRRGAAVPEVEYKVPNVGRALGPLHNKQNEVSYYSRKPSALLLFVVVNPHEANIVCCLCLRRGLPAARGPCDPRVQPHYTRAKSCDV